MIDNILKIRTLIQSHFGICLMIALLAGLFLPGAHFIPKEAIPTMMAVIIYFAISNIQPEDFKSIHLKDFIGFYLLRFLALPVIVFFMADFIVPDFKYAILLLLLLPSGATLPAVTTILKGNSVIAIAMLTLSSLLAPLIIPPLYGALTGSALQVDALGLFKTLAYIIFMPIGLYALTYKFAPKATPAIQSNAAFVSVFMISFVALTIVSSQRDVILQDLSFMAQALSIGLFIYTALYTLGWLTHANHNRANRTSYALACGNNNIVIGISLAFLYLPDLEILSFVTWELAWLSALSLFQYGLSKTKTE